MEKGNYSKNMIKKFYFFELFEYGYKSQYSIVILDFLYKLILNINDIIKQGISNEKLCKFIINQKIFLELQFSKN